MKNKKIGKQWLKYTIILIIIGIIGVIGFLAPYGHEKWNFIFENMIWLPFEIFITIFAINKVFELIEENRNRERFIRVTGKKNDQLIRTIKINIVGIATDSEYHDENRNEIELYNKIVDDPKLFFNTDLFTSYRTFHFTSSNDIKYNYLGILSIKCDKINTVLKEYFERYELYLDDDLFEAISNFESLNYSMGILNYKSTSLGKTNPITGDYVEMQQNAIDYIAEADKLIKLLETYKRKDTLD